jgi:hypothetical protein
MLKNANPLCVATPPILLRALGVQAGNGLSAWTVSAITKFSIAAYVLVTRTTSVFHAKNCAKQVVRVIAKPSRGSRSGLPSPYPMASPLRGILV